jgi:hypothetical protein
MTMRSDFLIRWGFTNVLRTGRNMRSGICMGTFCIHCCGAGGGALFGARVIFSEAQSKLGLLWQGIEGKISLA